jgi:ubiquinone biosynthesis protein COQ9
MAQAADLTLDELRIELAPRIAEAAIFDGWSDVALVNASAAAGSDPSVARLAFRGGSMDMIEAWVASVDTKMEAAFNRESLAQLPIRERIRSLVWFRLEAMFGLEEALRRALAIQAMPQNLVRMAKLGWSSADKMWRLAGDTATDYNHLPSGRSSPGFTAPRWRHSSTIKASARPKPARSSPGGSKGS